MCDRTRETQEALRPSPREGKAGKDIDCPQYEACLYFAAKVDWPAFHCEACALAVKLFDPVEFRAEEDEEEVDKDAPEPSSLQAFRVDWVRPGGTRAQD